MNEWLKADTFGMPRWAWGALLLGGLALGLYLRSRSVDDGGVDDEDLPPDPSTLGANQGDPGLAGVGVLGPPGGNTVPVQTPMIPEGFTEIVGGAMSLSANLGQTIAELAEIRQRDREGGAVVEIPEVPGGGPPNVPEKAHTPQTPDCTARDRAEIAKLRIEIRTDRARFERINKGALRRAQRGFRRARRRGRSGEGWQKQVRRLQRERRELSESIRTNRAKLQALRAKCS